jgi:peptidoglycan/LPS O-acetylase OafA/YrhL
VSFYRRYLLLTLVCTLIAPVFYWILKEKNKRHIKNFLLVCTFLVLLSSAVVQYSPQSVVDIKPVYVYAFALFIWVVFVFAEEFPPERKRFGDIMDDDAKVFSKLAEDYR